MWDFPLFPESASTFSGEVDALYFALVAITAFFTLAVYAMVAVFSVKYRRGTNADRSNPPNSNHKLEAVWIIIPLGIALAIFGWSAKIFFDLRTPPQDAMEIHVLGKQWMWKFVNEDGKYEVNEVHVPTGRPVKMTMISQDVIHDLFFPTFRTKQDVLPGRYSTLWFEATKPGIYPIYCAEYCGLLHSGMVGKVHVLAPDDYEAWLAGTGSNVQTASASADPVQTGEQIFTTLGCNTCHAGQGGALGPSLDGVYGHDVKLASGETVTADETYLRESIYQPQAKVVAGYQPVMPTFKGQVDEEQMLSLIAYIKSLSK